MDLRIDACRGDVPAVQKFIDTFGNGYLHYEVEGVPYIVTPFDGALINKRFNVVEFMLENGADIEAKSYDKRTPLMRLVVRENVEAVAFLLDHGANRHHRDDAGLTALDLARQKDNEKNQTMALMIEGKKPTPFMEEANTAAKAKVERLFRACVVRKPFKLRR